MFQVYIVQECLKISLLQVTWLKKKNPFIYLQFKFEQI